jgi:hypothetical protein
LVSKKEFTKTDGGAFPTTRLVGQTLIYRSTRTHGGQDMVACAYGPPTQEMSRRLVMTEAGPGKDVRTYPK